ncbi:MAG: hypothetical protein R3C45_14185 [Phycisphaerales bacterium]
MKYAKESTLKSVPRGKATKTSRMKIKTKLIELPEALADLVSQYKNKQGEPYDFNLDPGIKV